MINTVKRLAGTDNQKDTAVTEVEFDIYMDKIHSESNIDVPPSLDELFPELQHASNKQLELKVVHPAQPTKTPLIHSTTKPYPGKGKITNHSSGWNGGLGATAGHSFVSKCHHRGSTLLFTHKETDFYGATGTSMEAHNAAMIIDCANITSFTKSQFIKAAPSKAYLDLNDLMKPPPSIILDWPDYSAPRIVPLDFWTKMLSILPKGKVIVCCVGGHGRTGTCLAALMIASKHCTAKFAIELIRKHHCMSAVESQGQIDYLYDLENQVKGLLKKNAQV